MNIDAYDRMLKGEFGIDLGQYIGWYGNPGGVYHEVAYLMSRLISHPHVRGFMEVGAGLSTLIYATVSRKFNKIFVSLEDKEEWADYVNAALRKIPELVGNFQAIRTESDPANCPNLTEPLQLAWIDGNLAWYPDKGVPHNCCHRPGAVRYYKDVLMDALIIFDDGEDTHCRVEIDKVMQEMERDPASCFIWNPVGRSDRNQWICPPPQGTPLLDVLREVGSMR